LYVKGSLIGRPHVPGSLPSGSWKRGSVGLGLRPADVTGMVYFRWRSLVVDAERSADGNTAPFWNAGPELVAESQVWSERRRCPAPGRNTGVVFALGGPGASAGTLGHASRQNGAPGTARAPANCEQVRRPGVAVAFSFFLAAPQRRARPPQSHREDQRRVTHVFSSRSFREPGKRQGAGFSPLVSRHIGY